MTSQKNPLVIDARNLSKVYRLGAAQVAGLNGINLQVSAGELIVFKGNSGSGKSTLLSLLGGLDKPSSGQLHVAGYDLLTIDADAMTDFRRTKVGMVFQAFNLLPTLSVVENVCLPALLAVSKPQGVQTKARELLTWLKMQSRLDHFPSQLSGGEMQRTAIARALINDPAIILADEPTGNLDSRNGEAVIRLMVEMNQTTGCTLIIATHSTIADPFSDRELCLKDGRITREICEG